MASHPLTQVTHQVARFFFNAVSYTPHEASVVVAVVNLKGGCGKSTIAVNLACELASNGDSVLLLDNDSQGTSRHWWSHGRLPIRGESMPLENDQDGERLVRAVAASNQRYVVLDAPAHVGAATQAAGKIADLVLIPVTASGVDLLATEAAVELIRQARINRRSGVPRCLIVPSKIDRRTDAGRIRRINAIHIQAHRDTARIVAREAQRLGHHIAHPALVNVAHGEDVDTGIFDQPALF